MNKQKSCNPAIRMLKFHSAGEGKILSRNTIFTTVTDLQTHRAQLHLAADYLKAGKLVVFATETVYGIGANAFLPEAVAGIFKAKGRPQDNPLIVHIAEMHALDQLVREIPPKAQVLAKQFWPGPLTMILPRSRFVPNVVSAGLDTVAVRMPSHPVARALIAAAGVPVAAPSANLSGSPSPTTAQHCRDDLDGRVDMIVDSGACSVGVESTVVSLVTPVPRLLRPGAVTWEQLQAAIGEVEIDPAVLHAVGDHQLVVSPGMKYQHYAPKAAVYLVHGSLQDYAAFLQQHKREEGCFALAFDEDCPYLPIPCISYGAQASSQRQAERLFAALRELDEAGAKVVYARAPKRAGIGLAVYNRLIRAAAFTEIDLENAH